MRYRVWTGVMMACGIALSAIGAQAPKTVWDGIYSEPQAARGAKIYAAECAACHADDLGGTGNMPALSGPEFRKEWNGQGVGDLFERMSTSMPADAPGKLSRDQDAEVLAFILKSNGFPAGQAEIKGSTPDLSKIQFLAAAPK